MGQANTVPGPVGKNGIGIQSIDYNDTNKQFIFTMTNGSINVINGSVYNPPSLTGQQGPKGNTIQSITTSGDGINSLVGKAVDTNGKQYDLGTLPLYKDFIKNNIINCDPVTNNCNVPSSATTLNFGNNSTLNTKLAMTNNTTSNMFISGYQGFNIGSNRLNRDQVLTNRLLTNGYGPYMVVTNHGKNICLDTNECGQNSNTCGNTCDKTKDSQQWFYHPITGRLINKNGKCLDHANNNVTMKDCDYNSYDQYFHRTTDSEFRLGGGPCLDLNASNGNYTCLGTNNDNSYQRLALIPSDQI